MEDTAGGLYLNSGGYGKDLETGFFFMLLTRKKTFYIILHVDYTIHSEQLQMSKRHEGSLKTVINWMIIKIEQLNNQ